MHHLRRSCQSALLSSKSARINASVSRRAFTGSTPWRRGTLPQFLEPSSPELSTLLSQLNSKVLLPEHLNKEQQDLVFKKENRTRLEAEPITITLGNVTLPLEHINRLRDIPSRHSIIQNVVKNSSTPNDYENVLRMLEGFAEASIHLRGQWVEMIVRRLNEAGQEHLVLKALQRADKTNLRLTNKGLVNVVLRGLHLKAVKSDFEEWETEKALRFAEQIVELMEDKQHLGGERESGGINDPRVNPLVICVPTSLAAVRAQRHYGGQDKDGKVKKYSRRLMNAARQNDFEAVHLPKLLEKVSVPADDVSNNQKIRAAHSLAHYLYRVLPFWGALKTSIAILGSDMPLLEEASKIEKDVRDVLDRGVAELTGLKAKGFISDIEAIEKCMTLYKET